MSRLRLKRVRRIRLEATGSRLVKSWPEWEWSSNIIDKAAKSAFSNKVYLILFKIQTSSHPNIEKKCTKILLRKHSREESRTV